jgi:non-ribosomal peptide synthetase component E (peptide arylation enzyme)
MDDGSAATRSAVPSTASHILRHARANPRALALADGSAMTTYAELAAQIAVLTRALGHLRPGMLVGVETSDRALHLQILLACELLGVPTISLAANEVASGDTVAGLCDALLAETRPPPELLPKCLVLTADWRSAFVRSAREPVDAAVLDRANPSERIVRVARSSGTTAEPKLIDLTSGTLQAVVDSMLQPFLEMCPLVPRFLCAYHLTMRAPYTRALGSLQHGGTVVFASIADVGQLIAAGVVNLLLFLVGDVESAIRDARPPPPGHKIHIEAIGGPVSPALRGLVQMCLRTPIDSYYSSNEAGRIAHMDQDDVGTLCAGAAVAVVDEHGHTLPNGATGVIRVRTKTMASGYRNDPALSAARFVDGWFDTRDLGYVPSPGKLVVVGRADDALNIGGMKIAPGAMEQAIRTLPGVQEAVLVQLRPDAGSMILVALEVVPGADARALEREIDVILRPQMPDLAICMVRRLPRTPTGKVMRREVVALFERARANAAR